MHADEETLTAIAAGLDAETPEHIRSAIVALAADPQPARIAHVLELLRTHPRHDNVVRSLATHHREALLAALLPNADFSGIDVRTTKPRRYVKDWQGDLYITTQTDQSGPFVTIGSLRGARALRDLDREVRAPISGLGTVLRDESEQPAVDAILADLFFDGIRTLDIHGGAVAITRILRCPSLDSYSGPLDIETVDALATTSVRHVYGGSCSDAVLARLAQLPWLAELWVSPLAHAFSAAGIACFPHYPALTELHLHSTTLTDADASAIAECARLERLFLGRTGLRDGGGVALSRLHRLRSLDLHATHVGDPTACALAAMPVLEELDLAETFVGLVGVTELAKLRSLRRLGLGWGVPADVTAAANALGEGIVEWNDYVTGGSALWGSGYSGP